MLLMVTKLSEITLTLNLLLVSNLRFLIWMSTFFFPNEIIWKVVSDQTVKLTFFLEFFFSEYEIDKEIKRYYLAMKPLEKIYMYIPILFASF